LPSDKSSLLLTLYAYMLALFPCYAMSICLLTHGYAIVNRELSLGSDLLAPCESFMSQSLELVKHFSKIFCKNYFIKSLPAWL